MNLSRVIFNLDGVLCFADEYHDLTWKEAADSLEIYFERNSLEVCQFKKWGRL